jgi:hypothetical protein
MIARRQTRSFDDVCWMSGLPKSGSVLRQLLANAAVAASRVTTAFAAAAPVDASDMK